MKNNLVKLAVASVLTASMLLPMFAGAATVDELIATLQQQIATLKAQLDALRQAQQAVQTTQQSVAGTIKLIGQLNEGSSGDQVKLLQTLLAADPTLFPEGLIAGFYGRLTALAGKRFQKKFGIEQVGRDGPKTLEKVHKKINLSNTILKRRRTKTMMTMTATGTRKNSAFLRDILSHPDG